MLITLFTSFLNSTNFASEKIPEWATGLPELKSEGGWSHFDSNHVSDVGVFFIDFKKSFFLFRGIGIDTLIGTGRHGIESCQGKISSIFVSSNKQRIEFKGKDDFDPESSSIKFKFRGYIEKKSSGYNFWVEIDKGKNGFGNQTSEFYRTLKDKEAQKLINKIPLYFGEK